MRLDRGEIVRFCIVGAFATLLHYFIYWILKSYVNVNLAYTIGYVVSLVCNFFLTSVFTFRAKTSVVRGIGFLGAHATNYLIHMVLLNIFLCLGLSKSLAPVPVFMIAIPVNFLLVRYVFKHKSGPRKREIKK